MNTLDIYTIIQNYDLYIKKRRFDLIAIKLGLAIQSVCPYKVKEAYNDNLIGQADKDIKYTGYLGYKVFQYLPNIDINIQELQSLLEKKTVQKQLSELYYLSQEYLILPMMEIIKKKSNTIYQAKMNRYLNLHKLDGENNIGYITMELYSRLVKQNIMCRQLGRRAIYYTVEDKLYEPSIFVVSKKTGFSKPHSAVLKIVEKIVKDLNTLSNSHDKWSISNEYQYKHNNYPKPMRYDIALIKNELLFGLIEVDGNQHYVFTPHFHRANKNMTSEEVFQACQEKDKIKDNTAIKLCNGKKCLRIVNYNKESIVKKEILDWINILDNTEYSSTKYCNSFIEFTLEIFNKKNLIDLSLIVYENKKPVSIIPFFYDETKKIFFYERYKFDANTIIEPIFSNKCNNKTKNKIYEIFFSILTNKIDYILFSTTFCNNFQAPYWYLNRFDDCKLYEKKNFLYLDLEMLDSIKKKLKLPKIANKNRINILYKKNDKQIWNQIKNLHKKMHGSTRSLKSWELQKNSIDAGDGLLSYILDDKNNVSAANFFYITRDESRYAMSVSAENLANYCGAHLNISSLEFIKN